MKLKLLRPVILLVIIAGLIYVNGGLGNLFRSPTAQAVGGDITVDWGVAPGTPIFVVANFAPGQTESRTVSVTNTATAARPVGVQGILKSQTHNLDTVLDLVIKSNGSDVYGGTSGTGPKTLAQFFLESATISGIPLSTLPAGGNTHYSFIVTFDHTAGNDFQNANIVFDLSIGVFFTIPEACSAIPFSGKPIFGTNGNDHVFGTNGNDLIMTFDGNDVVDGGNGNDCIIAGGGNNNISGGNGNDVILVNGNGSNQIDGGNGNDVIKVIGNGNNHIEGGNGNDSITVVGTGHNFLDGGNDNDVIVGGNGGDEIHGGNGNDVITGGAGINKIFGENGNDLLTAGSVGSQVDGGNGVDKCVGGIKIRCEL